MFRNKNLIKNNDISKNLYDYLKNKNNKNFSKIYKNELINKIK